MEQLEFLLSGREEIASYESADRLRKTQGSERYWQGFQSVVLAGFLFTSEGREVLDGRRPGLCTPPTLPPFWGRIVYGWDSRNIAMVT